MATVNEITPDRLRALAETETRTGKVLSLFFNLDPTEFGTIPARATEVNAVLDEAERLARNGDVSLSHDDREGLKADVGRVRELVTGMDKSGARGLAVFACGARSMLEVLRLPRGVANRVAVGDRPDLEPLTRIGTSETWWVVLVSRQTSRVLAGNLDGLVEIGRVEDEIHGWHDQGGWSQARYQRSVENEAKAHLKHAADDLRERLGRAGSVDGILIGGTAETVSAFQDVLHPDVARCVEGRIECDVEHTSPDEVLRAAEPALRQAQVARDRELIARYEQGVGTGERAAKGLSEVLAAVHERRVEALLVREGFRAAGQRCPRCGWLGITAGGQCPADGTMTEAVEDVAGLAIGATLAQDAKVRVIEHPALDGAGGIAAVLRF